MTYPTRAEQFAAAEPKFIERAELETLTKVGAQVLYPLAVVASGLDAVTCQQTVTSAPVTFAGGGTTQTFWCPGANPLPAGTVQLAASPFTVYTPVTTTVAAVTRDPDGPGAEVTVTWQAAGDPALPGAGASLVAPFTAYADLVGAVLDTAHTHVDLAACDLAQVVDTAYVVRYRSKVKPLYSQEA